MQDIYDQHDVVCNQKYNKTLPYSFHLKSVQDQAKKYMGIFDLNFSKLDDILFEDTILTAAAGHDLIEDARMTYNDVINLLVRKGFRTPRAKQCADIIYACTETRGHTRAERHSQEYFDTLKANRLGVYVKLCDITANVLFSLLTNSDMYDKYKKEYLHLKRELYQDCEYDLLWLDLERYLGY